MITDFFPWMPDWDAGVTMRYKFDTAIAQSETGNEANRTPLYDKPKRTQTIRSFSPDYRASIENFLRKMHADFFQVPVFTEPIMPVPGGIYKWGDSLKNVTAFWTKGGNLALFNLNNLCSKILMVDLTDYANAELHTFTGATDDVMTIGGAFTNDFILGKTVYFPVMQSYVNSYGDTMATPGLVDTDLVLEEYY